MRTEGWCEMGRDIHVVLEKKTAAGWEFFDPGFECFDERFYPFFKFIEGIIDPGCPDELNHRQLRCQTEQWTDQNGTMHEANYYLWDTTEPCYLYGFGHATLSKLEREAGKRNTTWVSTDFLEKFHLLGGKLPEGMRVATETFDENSNAVGIHVVDEDDLRLRNYLNEGIAELKRIARERHLQDDELRICFAFDC